MDNYELLAILAADVVGYTRMMGLDEVGTHRRIRELRNEIVAPIIEAHRGILFKQMGDGFFAHFRSIAHCVEAAASIQTNCANRYGYGETAELRLRAAVHFGDVILDEGDLYGNGVNIAARLQDAAEPGGVAISDDAIRQIRNRTDHQWQAAEAREFKNVAEPVKFWRWSPPRPTTEAEPKKAAAPKTQIAVADIKTIVSGLAAHEVPSTVIGQSKVPMTVTPSDELVDGAEQDLSLAILLPETDATDASGLGMMARGFAADAIEAVSMARQIRVLSAGTTLALDIAGLSDKAIGQSLGASLILRSSLRAGSQPGALKLNLRLIDTLTGRQVWAERLEAPKERLPALRDPVAMTLLATIIKDTVALTSVGPQDWCPQPARFETWSAYHRACATLERPGVGSQAAAAELLEEALAAEPNFAPALGLHAYLPCKWHVLGAPAGSFDSQEVLARAEKALAADARSPLGHLAKARALLDQGEAKEAAASALAAIANAPNLAEAFATLGFIQSTRLGDFESALQSLEGALERHPLDPFRGPCMMIKGGTLRALGRYGEATDAAKAACHGANNALPLVTLAISQALAGETTTAHRTLSAARTLSPNISRESLSVKLEGVHPAYQAPMLNGLERLGL